jgi:hypothetical protein
MRGNLFKILLPILLVICMAFSAQAGVSAEEAARLGKDLTPMGSERAGNADSTIPAWDGGMTKAPKGFEGYSKADVKEGIMYPNPFADEKPLFTITAQNMAQYADKLNPGQKAMLERYPDTYKMLVYPTHRTAAEPQWIYDYTAKNAVTAQLTDDKNGFTGAYGGHPFPIPKNGSEVLFNHLNRWYGGDIERVVNALIIQPNGRIDQGSLAFSQFTRPYNRKGGEAVWDGTTWATFITYQAPARRKGEIIVAVEPANFSTKTRAAWLYMAGQRRIRTAPSIDHDNPDPSFAGLATYDDHFCFTGSPERFDWKLVGKKEIFIPYSNYARSLYKQKELFHAKHHNPEHMRWELHRVWEVEATLKEGSRHCYGKRVLFFDEDTWIGALHDRYDTRGDLWRTTIIPTANAWLVPCVRIRDYVFYDLQEERYAVGGSMSEQGLEYFRSVKDSIMTPQHIRKVGIR